MATETERLYRRWRELASKGYGETTSPVRMAQIDLAIRAAKLRYEKAVCAEQGKRHFAF